MIHVSDKWREAHTGVIVPESFVEITYEITEPGLQKGVVETNNGTVDYSNHADIIDGLNGVGAAYATLEHNSWALDGRHSYLPDTAPYGDTGYISSSVCNASGVFESVPIVTFTFETPHEQAIPGATFTWSNAYDEYPTRFRIVAYLGDNKVFSQEYENETVVTECEFELSGYNKIQIEILKWCLPYRRARMERAFFGITQTYTKSDLLSYTHSQQADLLSAELPKNSVTFSLSNADGIWNPENPTGNIKYLAERQKIDVRYGFKIDNTIEWIDAGTFWISEWDTPSNGMEAKFVARDMLSFMSETYTGICCGTLYEIALAALTQADLPKMDDGSERYVISEALKKWYVDFTEDDYAEYTLAEILQLCANASCCVLYQDRKGILRIEPLKENASGYAIKRFTSYSHPEFTLSKPLRSVSVNNGLGKANNSNAGEIQTISNPLITSEVIANRVAEWARTVLSGRKTLNGEYRADPTLDVLDKISAESKYGANNAIYVTYIEYSYNGTFAGKYTGLITDFDAERWYSGELYSGEV